MRSRRGEEGRKAVGSGKQASFEGRQPLRRAERSEVII
jgi:hypothetical protein